MANKIKGLTLEIGGNTIGLNKALADVNRTTRDLKSELRDVDRLLKLDPGNSEVVAQKQKILAEAVENTSKKLDTLKEAEKQAQEQFAQGKIGEEQYRAIQREVIKTEEELKKLDKQLKEMDWKSVTDGLDKFGKKATDIGKDMSLKVTAPIVAAGTAGTKMAMDLEHSIKKVSTLADADILPVDKIQKEVRAISDASGIAQTEIAESIYGALSAGVESEKVLEFVRSGIDLTRAGFTDMETAIDATTTVLNAYGDDAYDVTKIHDIFVQTQDKGKISVDELGKSLGRVVPTASSLGVNLDELGASYAILTAKGQSAELATTNLNSMLAEMGKSGSKTDKTLRELTGKSFADLISEGKSVGDVLGIVNEHAKENDLSLKDMFGSMTAGNAAVTLLSEGVEGYNKSLDDMNNATGKTADNAKTMEDGLFKIQKATTQVKNALIEFGGMIAPFIAELAEWISTLVERFASMDEGTKKIIGVMALLAAAIGPLLIVVGQMSLGVSALIKLFAPLITGLGSSGGAIAALTGPIGIAIAAITAMIAIGVALYKNWDIIKEKALALWNYLKQKFEEIKTAIETPVKNAIETLKNINLFEIGKNMIQGLINGIKNMIGKVKEVVGNVVSTVTGGLKKALKIQSPSKVMEEMGEYTGEGFAVGIKKSLGGIEKQTNAMAMTPISNWQNNGSSSVNHSGVIRVEGVNNRNELMSVVDIVMDELRREVRA